MGARGRWAAVTGMMLGCIATCLLSPACGFALAAGSLLPDGRAWEMVSPAAKNGGEINGIGGVIPENGAPEGGVVQASADGNSITFVSLLAFPDSKGAEPEGAPVASQYISRRQPGAWLTEDLMTPVDDDSYPAAGQGGPYKAFSTDLSMGLMLNGERPVENPQPPLVNEGSSPPLHYENYYLRDNATGRFEALLSSPPSPKPNEAFLELLGVTPDLDHIVVGADDALTPGANPEEQGNLYEWSNDKSPPLQAINVPPNPVVAGETAPEGAELGMGLDEDHAISNDGSRVFWSQRGTASLFVRENVGEPQGLTDSEGTCSPRTDACTVQMDATKIAVPKTFVEESGRGEFMTASANGSRAFFTDRRRLTPNSTAGGEGAHQDLYMFEVETGQLTDITIDSVDPKGASVLGVVEASEDGSYVYFVAEGALPGTKAVAGNDNLYLWHEGAPNNGISFIAALSGEDNGHGADVEPVVANDWEASVAKRTARVTSNGQRLVFMSNARLTGYDNRDANTNSPDEEVYLYDAVSGDLTCVSCNPSGARPIGPSGIPGGTPWRTQAALGVYQSRVLDEEGDRVFFDSRDALVPQDTNHAQDVYEWEQNGMGSCDREGGCVFLLSGGAGDSDASFVDASADGDDAFFVTRTQLVAQDTDQLRDLYDARTPHEPGEIVDFVAAESAAPPCEGEDCLPSVSSQSTLGPITSATFGGGGNLVLPHSAPAADRKKSSKAKKLLKHRKKSRHKTSVKVARRARGRR